jgi:hypothetical protein
MHSHQRRIKIAMLRIIHARTQTEQRWTLCGRLTRPWVAELRASWEQGRQSGLDARTVVDLSDVTFIDESGEKLLSEMGSDGAEFIAAGVETKHLLKNLRGKGERPLRRFIGPYANQCEKYGSNKNEGSK